MASVRLGENGDCSNLLPLDHDNFREPEIPSDSHESIYTFGEPVISPRIGDEYQAILPPLIQSHSIKCSKLGTKTHHTNQNFLMGLPLMLMWISTCKSLLSGPQSRSKPGSNTHSKVITEETAEELHDLPTAEKIRECGGRGYSLVPGLAEVCWNALEKESLLLGLYIFEKNFVNIRRFVEAKKMGDILSFYYGNFYSSYEYHRWSDCRKGKGKKGIYGARIFSGVRQQELLNRIHPHVPEGSRDAVLEMSKSFEDEKICLTEYVFYLKITVGIKILVDAVGIGKGKLDLTEMPLEPSRPAFPVGRAFSSFTTDEVIEILTGDYRLSKAKSNDIFWEAVWPRLLERGWQTVMPGKQTGLARPYLVYLVPGIKKFSRRKLVKGEHYFDSCTDILAVVSKQPDLIVLDSERVDSSSKKKEEKREILAEEKSEKHCYLQPRTPKRDANVVKFMVVDTSLSKGNIRELRLLPPEILDSFAARGVDGKDDDDTSEETTCGSNPMDMVESEMAKPDKKTTFVPDPKRKKVSREESQTKKVQKSQKAKWAGSGPEAPAIKRCRMLATTSRQGETIVSSSGVDKAIGGSSSQDSPARDGMLPSAGSSSWGGPGKDTRNSQPQFDLNLPQLEVVGDGVPFGPGKFSVPVRANEAQSTDKVVPNGPENGILLSSTNDTRPTQIAGPPNGPGNNNMSVQANEPPVQSNPLRLSTRTRPLTRRVIEAVEGGYLMGDQRRRRGRATALGENHQVMRPIIQTVWPVDPAHEPIPLHKGEGENGISTIDNGNSRMEPRVRPEAT